MLIAALVSRAHQKYFGNTADLKPNLLSPQRTLSIMERVYGHGSVDEESLQCITAVQEMATNILKFPFFQMLMSTAQDNFDIGEKAACD